MKIYEYDEKERIVKVDDKTLYLTKLQFILFINLYKINFQPMSIENINQLICNGRATNSFIRNFVKELGDKLGTEIKLKE